MRESQEASPCSLLLKLDNFSTHGACLVLRTKTIFHLNEIILSYTFNIMKQIWKWDLPSLTVLLMTSLCSRSLVYFHLGSLRSLIVWYALFSLVCSESSYQTWEMPVFLALQVGLFQTTLHTCVGGEGLVVRSKSQLRERAACRSVMRD